MRERLIPCLVALLALSAALLVAEPSGAQPDAFQRALADVDRALATNPNGVPEESLNSCRAMRKTAILLYQTGRHERAFRRLNACRKLLKLPELRSMGAQETQLAWRD